MIHFFRILTDWLTGVCCRVKGNSCVKVVYAAIILSYIVVSGCKTVRTGDYTEDRDLLRYRNGNLATAGYDVSTEDKNGDGKADVKTYRRAGTAERVEKDVNFDGQTNIWQYFSDGVLVEEEMDLDFDGKVDVINYFVDGVLNRKKVSVDSTQTFPLTKFYGKNGELIRVERDTDGDGKPDVIDDYDGR